MAQDSDSHENMLGALSGKPEVKGREKLRRTQVYGLATGRMVGLFSGKGKLQKVQAGHFGQAEPGKSASDTFADV